MKDIGFLMDDNLIGNFVRCPTCNSYTEGMFMPMSEIKRIVAGRNMQPYTIYADWLDINCKCGFTGYAVCGVRFAKEYYEDKVLPELEADK